MDSNAVDNSRLETNEAEYGRGKNKHFWTENETWVLIRCLQDMAIDPLWKTDGGFKNNYMNEIRRMMMQKMPNFVKDVKHIDSRIKFLKTKFHAISEMCKQSGCTWNDVEKRVACERSWYDEWVKGHKEAKSLYNMSFPYLTDLEMVYGKDRATGIVVEDPIAAAHNIKNVTICPSETDESSSDDNEVSMLPSVSSSAYTSNKRKKLPNRKSPKISKKPKVAPTQNAESEYKEFNDEVRSFMKDISGHYAGIATWLQGTSSRMSEVLDVLGKHGYIGANKFKAAKAICQDALNIDLLFNLDPAEVKEYVDAFI